jgi:hypothetical protein
MNLNCIENKKPSDVDKNAHLVGKGEQVLFIFH